MSDNLQRKSYFATDMMLRLLTSLCILAYVVADSDDTQLYHYVPECNRMSIPGHPNFYVIYELFGQFYNVHPCPIDHVFDDVLCDCKLEHIDPNYLILPTTTTTSPQQPLPPSTQIQKAVSFVSIAATPLKTTRSPTPYIHKLIHFQPVTTSTSTTTTATTSSTTTPKPIPSTTVKRKSKCDGCKFESGVGYKHHDTDCDKYVMCYSTGIPGQLQGDTRQCGIGKYWDQDLVTCRLSRDVYCPNDPCTVDRSLDTYSYTGDCGGYWKCQHGVSVGHCCPRGEAYSERFGCTPHLSCNSRCATQEESKVCDKISYPGDSTRFKQHVNGHGYVAMRCALGTVFVAELCRCDTNIVVKKEIKVCKKEVEMDFTHGFKDISGSGVHVEAVNVSLDNGSACFYGDSALIIPRFSNVEIGGHLDIRIRYKFYRNTTDTRRKQQALLYNGDCDQASSVIIATDPTSTSFGLRNTINRLEKVTVDSYKPVGEWNDAKFSLHHNVITIQQNGINKQKTFYGSVARSRCGLKIGWGQDFPSFTGCIDKLSISLCADRTR